jgi:hypothetical protein
VIFTIEGWEDRAGERRTGPPDDLDDTIGAFVHVTNPADPDEHHYFWAFQGSTASHGGFQTWEEWYVYIGALMEGHGMALE